MTTQTRLVESMNKKGYGMDALTPVGKPEMSSSLGYHGEYCQMNR
jgi:hypothetical protein